jgi:hypothetical protein
MSKLFITIKADTNDADYVEDTTEIDPKYIPAIRAVAAAIKSFKPYTTDPKGKNKWTHDNNYPHGECVRDDLGQLSARDYYVGKGLVSEEDFDIFDGFRPSAEYGIHTIESVKIREVVKEEKLL